MKRLTWSAPSSCSACPASLTISSLDLSPRSLHSRQCSEQSGAKWRTSGFWIGLKRGSWAVLCCVVFTLPVQPVAKIDGEHLVFVSPDEQCFLEEWKLKIVSSIFI